MNIVCIGNLFLDRVYQVSELMSRPQKLGTTSLIMRGGGPAPTAAIAAARLGVKTAFWGRVGDDAEGAWLKDLLARKGVDVSGMVVCPNSRTSSSCIMVDPAGERQILAYTDPAMDAGAESLPVDTLDAHTLILSDMRWLPVMPHVMDEAEKRGIKVLLDVDVVSPDPRYLACVKRADYVICADLGMRKMLGINDTMEALAELGRICKGVVAATQGAEGSLWNINGVISRVPAFNVPVADSTGAGDVFHGAMAASLAQGYTVLEAARRASATSALLCRSGHGWEGIPTAEEVDAFLAERAGR